MRTVLRIMIGLILVYLALCGALFVFQRSLIYFPQPGSADSGIVKMTLENGGERLQVSIRPHEGRRALMYFGGNAEDVSLDMPSCASAFPNDAIYLLNYRGYGGSTGNPSERALFADGLALFDRVHADHPDIELIGRSLGSGVAVYVASQRPVERLVLVTPYDSLVAVAAEQYPFVPVNWLLRDKFESAKYAPRVSAPTTIVAAENDEVIPKTSTEALRTRFREGLVSYHVVPGVGHNTISGNSEYLKLLRGQ
jgi:pimeloyl-ACP methyl ester carboxylesterase